MAPQNFYNKTKQTFYSSARRDSFSLEPYKPNGQTLTDDSSSTWYGS
jgi:hypothetical protein